MGRHLSGVRPVGHTQLGVEYDGHPLHLGIALLKGRARSELRNTHVHGQRPDLALVDRGVTPKQASIIAKRAKAKVDQAG